MSNNFSEKVLFKINIFNNILKKYKTNLFNKVEFIKFDESIFLHDFCDFYLIKNNDSIHFTINNDEIIIDISVFDECIVFNNHELENNTTIEIIESIFNGYINLIILKDNSKILSIHNYLGIEMYNVIRKGSFFWGNKEVKKSKLFLPK
ncbi:hypothetical protein [Flavobacterium sp. '19STA2R22 D10 B1']|uniref:hypothetical protein n=1 Tax=Flavobacterium aerium TaxID=3037261 RepID=UPI00278C2F77|nr:hypothetical protein [Flavobacterium sp. '19STA2R22 D10 B1']